MPSPHGHSTTYAGNRADGYSTNIYGNVYGNVHFPNSPGGPAFNQCLRDLRVTDPREDKARIEQDKDGLLKQCYGWILEDETFQHWWTQGDARLLWIKGDPGKGKTMMMIGLIDELSQKDGSGLLTYFFCQSTRPELNNAVSVLRGLIYCLLVQREQLMRHVQKRYDAAGKQLFEGPNALYALKGILSDILHDTSLPTTYLLVDALDECTHGLSDLLRIVTDDSVGQPSNCKWLLTSRNLPDIERLLNPSSLSDKVSLELNASHISAAVVAFVDYKVQYLAAAQSYDPQTEAEVRQQLRDKAEGTFLWVSLVCKELENVPSYRTRMVIRELLPGLAPLYDRLMAQILAQKDARTTDYCKDILRSVTLAYRPLQLEEIAAVAGLSGSHFRNTQEVVDIIGRSGSFLTVRKGTVFFVHLSAKDYLTSGPGQQVLNTAEREEQGRMAGRLLDSMHSTLQRDICKLMKPGVQIQDADTGVRNSTLPQIAYACEYWVDHLYLCRQERSSILLDNGKVHCFLQEHLLHWFEAMSLLQKMPEAMAAIRKLQSMLNVSG